MGIISIEGMEFFAFHGCFKEEEVIGTRFEVDIEIETDTTDAELSDDLAKTVNYQDIYLLVRKEMAVNSKLLEHVARRILNSVGQAYPFLTGCRVKIRKLNPPLGGRVQAVSVELQS